MALAAELGMQPLTAHCHLGLARIARREDRAAATEHDGIATAMFGALGMRPWPSAP
jgi:hypothetical protein